ncbi:MAG: DUF3299 domain-containing protein [Opitutales bacterium]
MRAVTLLHHAMMSFSRFLPAFALVLLVSGPAAGSLVADIAATVPAGTGYERVGFDKLASFTFSPPAYDAAAPDPKPAPKQDDQIPERIKQYNEKKVAVTGFMLPVKMDGGLVKEFLLVKDPMLCCYGVMPKLNEWVVVKMTGTGVKPLMDVPITFEGRLKVGEMFENGYLTGIYLLEGERMAETKD